MNVQYRLRPRAAVKAVQIQVLSSQPGLCIRYPEASKAMQPRCLLPNLLCFLVNCSLLCLLFRLFLRLLFLRLLITITVTIVITIIPLLLLFSITIDYYCIRLLVLSIYCRGRDEFHLDRHAAGSVRTRLASGWTTRVIVENMGYVYRV